MLHAAQEHLKCRASPACIATYPMCALISWGQSLQHSSGAVTSALYPTVLHCCRCLLDSLHWPRCPLSTSLLVSASPMHTHFERSSPSNLSTFSYNATQLSLSWQTQQTTLLLRTNLEPQCQRAAVSHDGNMAHLTSTETEKVSRQDCIGGRGKWDQIKHWDKIYQLLHLQHKYFHLMCKSRFAQSKLELQHTEN